LPHCGFTGSILTGATFDDAHAPCANFYRADAQRVSCRRADLTQSVWVDALAQDGDYFAASLASSAFHRAALLGAQFARANLKGADFSYASLAGAAFEDAKFDRTLFHRAQSEQRSWQGKAGVIDADDELFKAEEWSANRNSASSTNVEDSK
jgi:uncharacterized protein YjbI with pentapeptide repeats